MVNLSLGSAPILSVDLAVNSFEFKTNSCVDTSFLSLPCGRDELSAVVESRTSVCLWSVKKHRQVVPSEA